MKYLEKLDQIHLWIRSNRFLQLFTAGTRSLLGIGFILPGLRKFSDQPFTIMPPSSGVWAEYFHVLYRTGFYYDFLGGCQVLAGVLLMIPATAHIGNLIYFPIILNIAVLTNAIFGTLTPYITLLMTLASLWLLCWDYDRLKVLLRSSAAGSNQFRSAEWWWIPLITFAAGGMLLILFYTFKIGPGLNMKWSISLLTISLLGGLLVAAHHRFMK